MNYFLPHIGEMNFKSKALYLGYMVKNLLAVSVGHKNQQVEIIIDLKDL